MSKKSRILVIIQFGTMLYLLMDKLIFIIGFGFILQILAILIGIWGIIEIRIGNFNIQPEVKSNTLIETGPFKWIRNPMYTAIILFYIPIVFNNIDLIKLIVFIVLVVTLLLKIFSEEFFLQERFGENYSKYKKKSKRLIPFLY